MKRENTPTGVQIKERKEMTKIIKFKDKETRNKERLDQLFEEMDRDEAEAEAALAQFDLKVNNGKKLNEDDIRALFRPLGKGARTIAEAQDIQIKRGKLVPDKEYEENRALLDAVAKMP